MFWIDGRSREVVAHGGSTVQKKMVPFKTTRAEGFFLKCHTDFVDDQKSERISGAFRYKA